MHYILLKLSTIQPFPSYPTLSLLLTKAEKSLLLLTKAEQLVQHSSIHYQKFSKESSLALGLSCFDKLSISRTNECNDIHRLTSIH